MWFQKGKEIRLFQTIGNFFTEQQAFYTMAY